MKMRWKVCLLAFVSALALMNGAVADGKTKQKTWWRQKLIDADRELVGGKAAKEVSITIGAKEREALKKWKDWNSLSDEEKYNMYKDEVWNSMTDEEKNSPYFREIRDGRIKQKIAEHDEELAANKKTASGNQGKGQKTKETSTTQSPTGDVAQNNTGATAGGVPSGGVAGASGSDVPTTSSPSDTFADGEVNGRYAGGYMDTPPSDYISGKTGAYMEGGYPKVEDGKLVGAGSYMEGGYPTVEDGKLVGAGSYMEGGYPKVEDGKLVDPPSYMEGGYPKVEDGKLVGAGSYMEGGYPTVGEDGKLVGAGSYMEGGYPTVEDGKLVGAGSYMEGGYPTVEDGRLVYDTNVPTDTVQQAAQTATQQVQQQAAQSTSLPSNVTNSIGDVSGGSYDVSDSISVTGVDDVSIPTSSVANVPTAGVSGGDLGGAAAAVAGEAAESAGDNPSWMDRAKSGASAAWDTAKEAQQEAYTVTSTARGLERSVGVDTGIVSDINSATKSAGTVMTSGEKAEKSLENMSNASDLSDAAKAGKSLTNSTGKIEKEVTGSNTYSKTAGSGFGAASNTIDAAENAGEAVTSGASAVQNQSFDDAQAALKSGQKAAKDMGKVEKTVTGSNTYSGTARSGMAATSTALDLVETVGDLVQ